MITDLLKQVESGEGGYDDDDEDESEGGVDPYLESYYPDEEETHQMISKIMPNYDSNRTAPNNLSGFASVHSDSKTIQQLMMDLHTGASDETTYASIPLNTLEMSGDQKEALKSSRSNNL